jgi:MFS family permease
MINLWSLLTSREYRKYISASILTAIGGGMYFVAISWYLYKTSGSAMAIGGTLIISSLPGLLFSPWIGVLVDRWNVRFICAAADFARALILILVAAAMYTGVLGVKLIYLATFLIALCDNFFQPAVGALIRDVAPKDRLLEANITSNMSMQIGLLVGASSGGFLVAMIGTQSVVLINAVSFIASGLLTLWIRYARAAKAQAKSVGKPNFIVEFREAIRVALDGRFIIWLAVQQMLVYITLSVCNTLLPVFVDRELAAGAAGFGLIDAAWGIGALSGGLSLGYITRKIGAQWFGIASLAALAVFLTVLLTAHQVPQAMLAYFMLGCLAVMIRINSDTIIAMDVDPAHFGKIKAAISMFIAYMSLVVYGCVGYAGDKISVRWIYLVLALAILVAVLSMLWKKVVNDGPKSAGVLN